MPYSLNKLIKIYLFIVGRLCTSVEVSQSQLAKGIRRVAENVGDLCLDNPAAKGQFEEVLQVGGWVVEQMKGYFQITVLKYQICSYILPDSPSSCPGDACGSIN